MKETKSIWIYVLFFGAIWGILEATLGYVLQFLPPLVSGSVMFPIAATLMLITYQNTKSRKAMIYVAAIAATIKAINLFMPGLPAIKTYNPMIAIMLQSFVLVVFIPLFKKNSIPSVVTGIAVVGFSWRLLFLGNIAINNALTGFQFSQLASLSNMFDFVIMLGLIEALVLGLIHIIRIGINQKVSFVFKPNAILSLSTFVFAVVLTIFL
ncbi:hypothetical protein [Mariniplasma anaerobium]|uniref:Uncharacterized protein n=1 Tax=Mariniplasma anaerobium TaxID=2735436 RepID=A0A7U9XVA2_9MOLU|nr:hypothetical protein [Mariniplasma anaerobium]BCR36736.1 hypothetical protein MPAN_016290 [Mariniplasma anaerobium]